MTTNRLTCTNLSAGYRGIPVIAGVSLAVASGECVGVLGRNGVGKTTMARAIAGSLGRPLGGIIEFEGKDISAWPADVRARAGITFAPDNRGVFRELTVQENLQLAARIVPRPSISTPLEEIPSLLTSRWRHRAHLLSGGEQQILAIACALAASPRLLVIDELSEGLSVRATAMVEDWLVGRIAAGLSILLIDQRVDLVLRLATRCYVMDLTGGRGGIVLAADAAMLRDNGDVLVKHLAL